MPTELTLPVAGLMTYFADAALFAECLPGQRYPIAMEADYLALERAYLNAGVEPDAPLIARLHAGISMRLQMEAADRMTATVEQFHHVTPDAACPANSVAAEFSNTFLGSYASGRHEKGRHRWTSKAVFPDITTQDALQWNDGLQQDHAPAAYRRRKCGVWPSSKHDDGLSPGTGRERGGICLNA